MVTGSSTHCRCGATVRYSNIRIGPPLPLLGVKIIFRVGLVLLKCMLGTREKLKACQGQYETMELLRAIEPRYMQEGFLVREVKRAFAHFTDFTNLMFLLIIKD